MCTNKRWITNRYTGDKILCDCGHCKSCLQQKAARRATRIRNEYSGDVFCYFATLTYDRMACPYILHSDVLEKSDNDFFVLPVYRDFEVKWIPSKQKYKRIFKPVKLTDVVCSMKNSFNVSYKKGQSRHNVNFMPWLKKRKNHVGVVYYKDIQDFIKRFRQYLVRHGFDKPIKVFQCAEYGSITQRPHFHLLIFVKSGDEAFLHKAFSACWPYDIRNREKESFQLVTDDPAGYVASYVNGGASLPSFLQDNFNQKHSASKYFGHGKPYFNLASISEKVDRGSLEYNVQRTRDGVPEVVTLPVPKYVVNRFYPLFKGYSRLTSGEVFDYIQSGFDSNRLADAAWRYNREITKKQGYSFLKDLNHAPLCIDYSNDDFNKIQVRLRHAFEFYQRVFPERTLVDYACDFIRSWNCYKSTCYKLFRQEDVLVDFKFDNLIELKPDILEYYRNEYNFRFEPVLNVNERIDVVQDTLRMSLWFDKYDKQKKISNHVLSCCGINV